MTHTTALADCAVRQRGWKEVTASFVRRPTRSVIRRTLPSKNWALLLRTSGASKHSRVSTMPTTAELAANLGLIMPSGAAVNATKKKSKTHLLGGDPEAFIKDRKTGAIVTSCGRVGGSKGSGILLPTTGSYKVRVLEDNVAVEWNFNPFSDQYTGVDTIRTVAEYGNQWLRDRGYEMVPIAEHAFTTEELAIPKAQVFGCDPDFVAYDTADQLRSVDPLVVGNNRFCGGHLHFGFENPEKIPLPAIAILIDMFIGLPSLPLDHQKTRRKWYGLA